MKYITNHIFNKSILVLLLLLSHQINSTAQVIDTLEMVWHDEFDGKDLDVSKWKPCPEWARQGGCFWKKDNYLLTDSGQLRLDITQVGDTVFCGAIRTKDIYYQKYGYFEVSCKLPQIHGGWCAFWMMPNQNIPGNEGVDGTEIDIFESINGWQGAVNHALHWDGYGVEHQSKGKDMQKPELYDDAFHKFGLYWTPSEYVFYIDDTETWRTSAGGVSQVEQYMKLTMEVSDASWPGNWADQIEKPIYWYIDYVRTYKYKPVTSTDMKNNISTSEEAVFSVYPNPAKDFLTIVNPFEGKTDYSIITTLGQLVQKGSLDSYYNQINISSLPVDIYFLQIERLQIKVMKCE